MEATLTQNQNRNQSTTDAYDREYSISEYEHLHGTSAGQRADAARRYREGKKTAKDMIGMPIISLDTGEQLGEVHDVVYSAREARLMYFTIPQNVGLFGGGKTLLLRADDVRSLGEDAITIRSASVATHLDRDIKDVAEEAGEPVLGKRLMTDDGTFLGNIADVLIDRENRKIVAYEVTGGFFRDAVEGRTDVPTEFILSFGKDVVIVPATVKDQIVVANGGLKGAASAVGDKATDAWDATKAKANELTEHSREMIAQREGEFALGKVAHHDVTADDGTFIVRQGETVDVDDVSLAHQFGKTRALALATGMQQASEAWDATKTKAGELTEQARTQISQKEGDYARGKLLGRDVMKEDGTVFARQGETVTDEHVALAHQYGRTRELALAAGLQHASDTWDTAKTKVQDKQGEVLVGRTTGKPVYMDDQNTIELIPTGTTLTEGDVAKAREAGKLNALTAAVGSDVAQGAKDRVAGAYDGAKAKVADSQAERDRQRELQAATNPDVPVTPVVIEADTVIVERAPANTTR